jgi:CHASE3 domain sensor protein
MRADGGDSIGQVVTLARRIWLGFGVLLLSLLALGLTAYLGVRAIHDDARYLAGSEQTKSEAVGELRSQVLGTEAAVFGYLQTDDPRYRDEISQRTRMFERAEEQLGPVAASDLEKKSVARAGDIYHEYTTTAAELMRERDTQRELSPRVEGDLQKSRTILVDMRAGVEKTGDDAKLRELAETEQGLDG